MVRRKGELRSRMESRADADDALDRYIEAIETRLHRMEALLGGLLQNDDPRAAQLLGELIGECREPR